MGGSRWNPTAEQLLALEEMYRCGTRTPTTDQIQQIASELRRFGKIEGKNVFYWFQNHKARERQKSRRGQVQQKNNNSDHESLNKLMKESGLRRTVHELGHTKNSIPHSNCSAHVEGPVSVYGSVTAESRRNGWSEFEEKELQQMKSSRLDMHAMWLAMDLSSSPPVHPFKSIMTTTNSKLLSLEEHSSLLRTSKRESRANHEDEIREVQTLQLFPLCSDDSNGANGTEKVRQVPIRTINTNFSPGQFFEFLPLKN